MTTAEPTSPAFRRLEEREAVSWRSSVSGRRLFGPHNPVIAGGYDHGVDVAPASVALRKLASAASECWIVAIGLVPSETVRQRKHSWRAARFRERPMGRRGIRFSVGLRNEVDKEYQRYFNTGGMGRVRLTREQQSQRNRSLVLAAARRVFLACGYHGASLEQIATDAGFSKGVVYSQFESKADLFLALLEQRIEERAGENARLVEDLAASERLTTDRALMALAEHVTQRDQADPEWGLLVIEFRVHAARNPDVNRRYAVTHERTVAGVAGAVARIYESTGDPLPLPAPDLARLLLTVGAGARLEQATNAQVLPNALVAQLLARVPSSLDGASRAGISKRRRVA
jgi:AcrR family transcriptional regulator